MYELREVMERYDLSRTDAAVYLDLQKLCKNHAVPVFQQELAAITGMNVRTIQRALKRLKELNLITTQRTGRASIIRIAPECQSCESTAMSRISDEIIELEEIIKKRTEKLQDEQRKVKKHQISKQMRKHWKREEEELAALEAKVQDLTEQLLE